MSKDSHQARALLRRAGFILLSFFLFLGVNVYANHPQGEIRYSYHTSQTEAVQACSATKGLKDNFCGTCMGPLATSRHGVFKYQGVWFHGSGVNRVTNCVFFFPIKACGPRKRFAGPAPGSCKSTQ